MSEVKWIKIATDVFNNNKIKIIEAMPEGDALIVIWFKILMLAGDTNDNGLVYFAKNLPFNEVTLSTVLNKPLAIIKLALNTFEQFGMIEIVDDFIHISNWEKYQNVSGMEKIREQTRLRVAKHREHKRLQMDSLVCSYCGGKATGYDHIIAISRGGKDIESNKTPCCIECNRIKNDKPLVDFLNNNRDRIDDSLIMSNEKLGRYVTLCNVTNCYTVTQSNATDKDIEEEIDKDIEKDKKEKGITKVIPKKKGENIPPTLEEVKEYCIERNNNIDAERFYYYYQSNGWYVGKKKMKNWHSAMVTWERNQKENNYSNYKTPNKAEQKQEQLENRVLNFVGQEDENE